MIGNETQVYRPHRLRGLAMLTERDDLELWADPERAEAVRFRLARRRAAQVEQERIERAMLRRIADEAETTSDDVVALLAWLVVGAVVVLALIYVVRAAW